jgi:hypothetical protein
MRQIALKFGIVGGVLITVPMFIIIPHIDSIGFDKGITILFISMVISSVRKNVGGGYIGFRQAFVTGIIITVITSVFYVAASLVLYNLIRPDFTEKLNAFAAAQMKAAHSPQADINKFTESETKQNIFVITAMMFIKPLMLGLFFTFPSSLILRKQKFPASLN